MSEKLAVLGRLGAEELADVLNLLFSALLADAAAYGGSLLKYGGDAVLLFFEGDDHAARGAAATHRMRATLRRLGTIKTSRGTVRVRMSVGIHSGEFDFFLVGDTHRELIVTGPGATTTTEMETEAEAGEILISPETAALIAPSCVGAKKGDGYLLKRIPRTEAKDPLAWGVVPDVDPLPFIPVGLHQHIGGVGTDAEHRHIAVGFVAFGGVDELLAAEGGERTGEVLEEFIGACQAAFARYDVCFLYADVYGNGGKVFFIVGAPVSHEDNEERILRAALEINNQHFHGLHLHTGLNRGYVFAGDIGAEFRRTYTVLGDAVNTAARVMASCNADAQVRAMPEVLDLASSRFAAEAQAPFAAKGKALPLETYAVGEALGPKLSDTPLTLIGRDDEMAALRERLDNTEAGHGQILYVVGEPGIGKSRLVEELRQEADARGWATVTTFAERYEQSTVYFVLRQLYEILFDGAENDLDKMLARAEELAPAEKRFYPLLGRVLGLDVANTSQTSGLTEQEVSRILGRMTVSMLASFLDGPSMWVMENAHLVDEASASVIANVAAELQKRQWLLIAVRRSDETGGLVDDAGDIFAVESLTTEAGLRLARTANPAMLPHDARTIAERSNGNPLFLRQLVAAHEDGGQLSDSVETAVSSRIDRLPTTERDVLRTASVLGGRFELVDLRELLGGRAPDLAPLQDFLMTVDGSVVFRQALYREVAYEGLTFRRRRALHLAAGRLLENEVVDDDTGPFERLSLHFDRAQAWDKSWKYSRIAAERARFTIAKSVAASFYDRAIAAGRKLDDVSPEDLGVLAAYMGEALFTAGRAADAQAAFTLGHRLTPKNTFAAAMVDFHEAALHHYQNDFARAGKWFRRGLDELAASGTDVTKFPASNIAVRLRVGLADIHLRKGNIEGASALLTEARSIADVSGDLTAVGDARTLGTFLALAQGDLATALVEGEAALNAFRAYGQQRGSIALRAMNLGALKGMASDWQGAAELYEEAYAINSELGNDGQAALTQVNLAELFIDQGRFALAETTLADCEPILRTSGAEGHVWARVLLSRLKVRTGRFDDLDFAEPDKSINTDELVYTTRVEAAVAQGDVDAAREELAAADAAGASVLHRPVIDAVLRRLAGEDENAAEALALSEEAGDRFGAVMARAMLGQKLEEDDDAQRLGIVALPHWVSSS